MKNKLTSKPTLLSNFGIIVLSSSIFLGIGIMLILRFLDDLKTNEIPVWSNLVFPIIIFVFVLNSINFIIKNNPKIVLDKTGIRFSTFFKIEFYQWTEIEAIQMTGKEIKSYLFTSLPLEATILTVKGGEKKCILADNYSNISDIRLLLESIQKQLFDDKKEMVSLDLGFNKTKKTKAPLLSGNRNEYKGNHFLSFNGITLYVLIAFFIFALFSNTLKGDEYYRMIGVLGLVFSFFCGLLSNTFFYFIVTDKHIIVKNNVWFWYIKVYELENIKEIVLETPPKQSTCLRVITKEYESRLYQASSLSDPTWGWLKDDLLQKGISIRNETNF